MNKKWIIVGIVAVVAIFAIAVFATSGESENNGEFDYTLEKTTSFDYYDDICEMDRTETAETGKTFVVATITLMNTNYSSGIRTSPINFELEANGVSYSYDIATCDHPGYKDTVTLNEGAKYTFVIVFQVPLDFNMNGAEIVWDGFISKVVYNPELV